MATGKYYADDERRGRHVGADRSICEYIKIILPQLEDLYQNSKKRDMEIGSKDNTYYKNVKDQLEFKRSLCKGFQGVEFRNKNFMKGYKEGLLFGPRLVYVDFYITMDECSYDSPFVREICDFMYNKYKENLKEPENCPKVSLDILTKALYKKSLDELHEAGYTDEQLIQNINQLRR